jgi:hypothetical protein
MKIIGCDFHPSHQQIPWLDTATGEVQEAGLDAAQGEASRAASSGSQAGPPESFRGRRRKPIA